MNDIGADDDGGILTICEEGNGLGVRDGVDTAELDIDPRNRCEHSMINQSRSDRNLLQADIRVILWFGLEAFVALEALSSHADLAVRETKRQMND